MSITIWHAKSLPCPLPQLINSQSAAFSGSRNSIIPSRWRNLGLHSRYLRVRLKKRIPQSFPGWMYPASHVSNTQGIAIPPTETCLHKEAFPAWVQSADVVRAAECHNKHVGCSCKLWTIKLLSLPWLHACSILVKPTALPPLCFQLSVRKQLDPSIGFDAIIGPCKSRCVQGPTQNCPKLRQL